MDYQTRLMKGLEKFGLNSSNIQDIKSGDLESIISDIKFVNKIQKKYTDTDYFTLDNQTLLVLYFNKIQNLYNKTCYIRAALLNEFDTYKEYKNSMFFIKCQRVIDRINHKILCELRDFSRIEVGAKVFYSAQVPNSYERKRVIGTVTKKADKHTTIQYNLGGKKNKNIPITEKDKMQNFVMLFKNP